MSRVGAGAALGLGCGAGLLLVCWWIGARRPPRVALRIRQFVGGASAGTTGEAAWRDILALVLPWRAHRVALRLRGRLARSGSADSPVQFRLEQAAWCGLGALAGGLAAIVVGAPAPLAPIVLAGAGAATGALAREWSLSRAVHARTQQLDDELPATAELLAFALSAGESPHGALVRLARGMDGELAAELGAVVGDVRSGMPLESALRSMSQRTASASLARFVDAMLLAIERGTPLADVARAQAADVRSEARRRLLTTAGRKDVAMLAPVVFLILPTVVAVALFPGISGLRLFAP